MIQKESESRLRRDVRKRLATLNKRSTEVEKDVAAKLFISILNTFYKIHKY